MSLSDRLGLLVFSTAPFLRVKRVFFHPVVAWPVFGGVGLTLASWLIAIAFRQERLAELGTALAIPFLIWVPLLAVVSLIVALPRFAFLGVAFALVYLGQKALTERLLEWARKYDPPKKPRSRGPVSELRPIAK